MTLNSNINWSSPEVLNKASSIDQSADVWSLAIVITEIFTGNIPFDTKECRAMELETFKNKVEQGMRPDIPHELFTVHPWFKEMVFLFSSLFECS